MIKVFDKERFVNSLPPKVRGCNTYEQNRLDLKVNQIDKKMIQLNHPRKKAYLIYDIDRNTAFFDWNDLDCPRPTWIAKNPENGHCHLVYQLTEPVGFSGESNKVTRYCEAVYYKLREKLHGDIAYSADLTKNPLRTDVWDVTYYGETYLLDELASSLDMEEPLYKTKDASNSGSRNCEVFEKLSRFARNQQKKRLPRDRETLEAHAAMLNQRFDKPMSHREVMGIAKSVADYYESRCGKSLSHNKSILTQKRAEEFSIKQAERGKKGGEASARTRDRNAHEKVFRIFKYMKSHKNHNQAKMAKELGYSPQVISLHMDLVRRMLIATAGIPKLSIEAYQDKYQEVLNQVFRPFLEGVALLGEPLYEELVHSIPWKDYDLRKALGMKSGEVLWSFTEIRKFYGKW